MLRKFRGLRSHEQDVSGVLHDQAGGGNRMENPFDRGNRASSELCPFHDRGVHPLHTIELAIRPPSCVKQTGLLEKTDGTFDGDEGRASLLKNGITDDERIGQAGGLRRRHASKAGASMGKNEGSGTGQLRSRSRTWR